MANSDDILAALQAEMELTRATISQQQDVIAQQQVSIAAQQASIVAQQASIAALQHTLGIAANDAADMGPQEPSARTSRRGFLGAAAVGAAAATAATVAAVGAPTAHAATGGNVILGQVNDANATTVINLTTGTYFQDPLLTVYNSDAGGKAIVGQSLHGIGVHGIDTGAGIGVQGESSGLYGAGVVGFSQDSHGVIGHTVTGIDLLAFGTGRVFLSPQPQVGAPPNPNGTAFGQGEMIRDFNGDLWLCMVGTVASGTGVVSSPAQWAKVDIVRPGLTGGGINYLAKPIRLLDTRAGQSAFITPGAPYAPGTHTLQVGGDSYNGVTVPTSLAGAIGNVTVVNPQGSGYLALVPKGAGNTGAAVLAFSAGQIVSNSYNVGLSADAMDILIVGATTDVIVDLFAIVG